MLCWLENQGPMKKINCPRSQVVSNRANPHSPDLYCSHLPLLLIESLLYSPLFLRKLFSVFCKGRYVPHIKCKLSKISTNI